MTKLVVKLFISKLGEGSPQREQAGSPYIVIDNEFLYIDLWHRSGPALRPVFWGGDFDGADSETSRADYGREPGAGGRAGAVPGGAGVRSGADGARRRVAGGGGAGRRAPGRES